VAQCAIHQPYPWLDVAWHGLVPVVVGSPFGSPASLAPLTSSKHERQPPEPRYRPRHDDPGVMTVPDVQPQGLRGQPPEDTSAQRHPVQARVQAACRRPPRRQIAMSP
jgi:hypothetical protein